MTEQESGDPTNNGKAMNRATKPRILFICTHNSARSQIAEGYIRKHYSDLFEVGSAGTEVREVNPLAVAVMHEVSIDISRYRSKLIDEFFDRGTDIVVNVCDDARKACPFFPGAKETIHVTFPDPSACTESPTECLSQFRQVRDAIFAWIDTTLVPEYGRKPLVS
jgi:arsenate reductase